MFFEICVVKRKSKSAHQDRSNLFEMTFPVVAITL